MMRRSLNYALLFTIPTVLHTVLYFLKKKEVLKERCMEKGMMDMSQQKYIGASWYSFQMLPTYKTHTQIKILSRKNIKKKNAQH
jgi:hypothetical protein